MKRPWRTVLALALALAAGCLAVALAHRDISRFSSDSFQYLLLGESLAEGRGFVSGGSQHPDLSRAPLLPLLIAPFTWLLGNPVRAGIAVVSLAAAALAVPLFFLCRDLFGPRAGWAALPLAAVSCVLGTADRVLPTSVHLLALAGAAALMVRALRVGSAAAHTLAGLGAGLTALARPEGLPFLALPLLWVLLGPDPRAAAAPGRPLRARLAGSGALIGGAALIVVPYLAWSSARLHRFAPLPAVEYIRDARYVADRFGLRHVEGPWIGWEERALFLLTEDRRERVLDLYFRTRVLAAPEEKETRPDWATAGPSAPETLRRRVARRAAIVVRNLREVPRRLHQAHLLPPVPVLLGLAGLAAWLPRRRGWRPVLFTGALMGFGFLPLLSHLEDRFLYVPFAAGLLMAAAGWGEIDRLAAGRLHPAARAALHGVLLWGVAASGLTHRMGESPDLGLERAQRTLAVRAASGLAPGPVFSVRPHLPYWIGRRYAPLPVGSPAEVLACARVQDVRALTLQVPYDLKRRPHLAALAGDPPPPGFVRADAEPIPGGGEILLFRLDPEVVSGLPGARRTP